MTERQLLRADDSAGARKWAEARDEYLAALSDPAFDWRDFHYEEAHKMGIAFAAAGDHENLQRFCRDWFGWLGKNPDPKSACLAVRVFLAGETNLASDLGQLALKWSEKMTWPRDSVSEIGASNGRLPVRRL
jgi:hypothetical protein